MSSKVLKVAKFELIRQIKKISFWVAILITPLMIGGLFGLNYLNAQNFNENLSAPKSKSIGIFDEIGVIDQAYISSQNKSEQNLAVKFFETEAVGLGALKNGEINNFYHIPKTFDQDFKILGYGLAKKSGSLFTKSDSGALKSLIRISAAKEIPPTKIALITEKYQVFNQTIDKDTGESVNMFGKILIPLAILAVFYMIVVIFGNRMLMTVVEEKETRISEMILTAVSARDLIFGKLIAVILLGFVQIACMLAPVLAGLLIYRDNPMIISIMGSIEADPLVISINVMLLLISFLFVAALCVMVGTLTPTAKEASQYVSIVMLGVFLPFFFTGSFTGENPDLATHVLTYFPLSAPISLMFRNAVGTISLPELGVGVLALCGYTAIMTRLAFKSFEKHAINFSLVKPNLNPRKVWKKYRS